jgi:hypothetical protein
MNDEIRDLSATEIDAVAGGLQYNDNPQNYILRPPPVDTAPNSWSWGMHQSGTMH